jgi:uncharacterized protein (TIGR03067 family)
MFHSVRLAMLAAVALTSGAQADDAKKDLDRLQGEWKTGLLFRNGNLVVSEQQLVITGDKFKILSGEGKTVLCEGTFHLEPAETPKRINLEVKSAIEKTVGWGPIMKLPGSAVGIYEFKADTELGGDILKLCWGPSPRPEEFYSGTDKPYAAVLFRRAKK